MPTRSRFQPSARRAATLTAFLLCTFTAASAQADDPNVIASASYIDFRSPDASGELATYARGGSISLMFLCGCGETSLGGELQASFLGGDSGRRVYDLGLSFIVSHEVEGKTAAPYLRLGLNAGAVSAEEIDDTRRRSIMAGVHGGMGVQGFVGDTLYWRAELGFLGAGPGGVRSLFSLGYRLGE